MRVKLWGVRGSLPAPETPKDLGERLIKLVEAYVSRPGTKASGLVSYLRSLPKEELGGYGGNTTCVSVSTPEGQVLIDAGSGIRPASYELMQGPLGAGKGKAHIYFTHFHWDHIKGLAFFVPIFIPGNEIHVYAVQDELEKTVRTLFLKPYFPVSFEKLGAKIFFHKLAPRQPSRQGDLLLTPYQLDHPDPCWGYRVEHNGKALAHCVDTEALRTSREQLGADLPLYQNADTMIFDAQYTLKEALEKVHWGHAAATLGLDLAFREDIRRVYFTHHDPASDLAKITAARDQTREYYERCIKEFARQGLQKAIEWHYAVEGIEFDV